MSRRGAAPHTVRRASRLVDLEERPHEDIADQFRRPEDLHEKAFPQKLSAAHRKLKFVAAQRELGPIGITDGVTAEAFDACLKDQALQDKILSRLKEASDKYKVDATPSFIVQGELHSGEISYDDFKALLDKALGHS